MTKVYSMRANPDVSEDGRVKLTGNKYLGGGTSFLRYPTFSDELRYPRKLPGGLSLEMPSKLEFSVSSAQRLDQTDLLSTDTNQDVLSNRLIDALQSAGEIDCKLIPTHFFNDEKNEVCNDRFSCLLFNEYCDCFDYENAEYEPTDFSQVSPKALTERRKKQVNRIRKVVLIEPPAGFPPIFRLLADASWKLLVSERGKKAVMDSGITGVVFRLMGDFS